MIRNKLIVSTFLLAILFAGCSFLEPYTIPREMTLSKYSKTYDLPMEKIVNSVYEAVETFGWKKLEEHRDIIKKDAESGFRWSIKTTKGKESEYAWKSVAPKSRVDDLILIKLKTPTFLDSYGALIFVGVSLNNGVSTVKYSGTTSQIVEKPKLDGYIESLMDSVESSLK